MARGRAAAAVLVLLPLTGCVTVYQEPRPSEPSAKIEVNRDISTPDARGIIVPALMDGLPVSYPPFKGPHMLVTPGLHQVGLMFSGWFRASNAWVGAFTAPNQARATVEARLESGRVYLPRAKAEYQKIWLWLEEKDSGRRVSPEVPGELRRMEPVRFYF